MSLLFWSNCYVGVISIMYFYIFQDEINEILFFDILVFREVVVKIFQYLSMLDLCRCVQVFEIFLIFINYNLYVYVQ